MLLPFPSKYSGVIQRRRLLAQGYILILLRTVSSATGILRQCFWSSKSASPFAVSFYPSYHISLSLLTLYTQAHPQGQRPRREALNVHLQSREYNGARRNLATSPGNTSPLFYPQREGCSVMKKQ